LSPKTKALSRNPKIPMNMLDQQLSPNPKIQVSIKRRAGKITCNKVMNKSLRTSNNSKMKISMF
jgi:hypothetical protein